MRAIGSNCKIIYWHWELPPLEAEAVDEHVVEATSNCVPGTLSHRDELWNQCYEQLMACAGTRLEQEVARLGGDFAHVLVESVESRHDGPTSESWLRGRYTYVLYRLPRQPAIEPSAQSCLVHRT
jgi:hypothetical protein